MFDFSPIQILIVLALALLVFGPKRLPEMARSVGRGVREFKSAVVNDEPPAPPASTRAVMADAPDRAASGAPDLVKAAPEDDISGLVVSGDDQPPGARPT